MELKDTVYEFISSQVTLGELKQDDRLTEQLIAEKLGLSRTPVREALLQLSATDVIERIPNKGFKMKTYTAEEIQELYELVGVLDGKVAYLSLPFLTEDDFSRMQYLIDCMNSAIKNKLYTVYNSTQEEFHAIYAAKCPNKKLVSELVLKKKFFIGKAFTSVDPAELQAILYRTNDEHQTILTLLQEKKADEVRSFIELTHWNPINSAYDMW